MVIAPKPCWVAVNAEGEAFGVGYDVDGRGEICGHTILKLSNDGRSISTITRYPGKGSFAAARADAVLASAIPGGW